MITLSTNLNHIFTIMFIEPTTKLFLPMKKIAQLKTSNVDHFRSYSYRILFTLIISLIFMFGAATNANALTKKYYVSPK